MIRIVLCLSMFLAACGDNLTAPSADTCGAGLEPYDGPANAPTTVKIWVQPDSDLDTDAAQEGCELWMPKGLSCDVIATESGAAARIYASHDACVEAEDGGYVLAVAWEGGNILVYAECVRKLFIAEEADGINRQALKLILGHEIGHQTGMWWHVPATCEDAAAADDFEKGLVRMGVCGPSLMNARIDTDVCFMSDLDAAAYDLRDPTHSTFPRAKIEETQAGCVLTYRPAP